MWTCAGLMVEWLIIEANGLRFESIVTRPLNFFAKTKKKIGEMNYMGNSKEGRDVQ